MATIVPISTLPSATSPTGSEHIPIVQSGTTKHITLSGINRTGNSNLIPGTNITITEGTGANIGKFTFASTAPANSNVTLTGFFNDLASQSTIPGYDYMEWTSNSTGIQSVPAIRLVQNLKLVKVAYVWLGDDPLQITGSNKLDFTVRKLTPGATSHIENYTQVGNIMVTLDSSDNNTNPSDTVTLASPITLSESDMISVIAQETGTITPTNGELSMTFLFEVI